MRNLTWVLVALVGVMTACNRSDTQLTATAIDRTTTPDSFLQFTNNPPEINNNDYTQKYYDTVDPTSERMTLAAWKSKNGFDSGVDVHVTFRDTRDLGYGRDMYARCSQRDMNGTCTGDIAIYVDNYVVQLEPGDASTYGPLNLDAAIDRVQKYHIGTNTIEFSAEPNNAALRIAKFFAFAPRDANGTQHRLNSLDMDGRGIKSMPNMCAVCHGGTMYPLRSDGSFDPISLKSLKLNILEEDAFQFSSRPGFTRSDQQAGIKAINRLVFDTYAKMNLRQDSGTDQANWDSSFAMELVDGAYGNNFSTPPAPPTPESAFNEAFVPAGWTKDGSRPIGVEDLYRTVIRPHCIGCHALRGTQIAENPPTVASYANAINFSSYEGFIGYNDRIIDTVYRRGSMPASLLNYSGFWSNPSGVPTELSKFLGNFMGAFPNGAAKPGKSVAIPGGDPGGNQRRNFGLNNTIRLDASASLFTDRYSWSIVPAVSGTSRLFGESTSAPELTTDPGATVNLQLITSNSLGDGDPVTIAITNDNSFALDPTFRGNVASILSNGCVACHASSSLPGIPVYFDDSVPTDDLYRRVRARVNLKEPENSVLLLKATNKVPHGGGPTLVVDTPDYHTILNWIRNGAPELHIANMAPTANAGLDRSVVAGSLVSLNGSGSDLDGDSLTYAWTLSMPPGSNALLSVPSSQNPNFTVDVVGQYVASLVVNDGEVNSPPDSVTITATIPPPTANAGQDQSVTVNTSITLDGSASTNASSYAWSFVSQPPLSSVPLANANTAKPSFTPDVAGSYVVRLTVSNSAGSNEDTVIVTGTPVPNDPPIASAGEDQVVNACAPTQLNGSGSSDPDNAPQALTYQWSLTGKPSASSLTSSDLLGAGSSIVTIVPDLGGASRLLGGTYTLQLEVSDGIAASTDSATVTANWVVFNGNGSIAGRCSGCHSVGTLQGKGNIVKSRFSYTLPTDPLFGRHKTNTGADTDRVNPALTGCEINEVATYVDTPQ